MDPPTVQCWNTMSTPPNGYRLEKSKQEEDIMESVQLPLTKFRILVCKITVLNYCKYCKIFYLNMI